MATPKIGHSTTLVGSTSGTIAKIENLNLGPQARDAVETTALDAATDNNTYIGGMIEPGELTFDQQLSEASAESCNKLTDALEVVGGQIETWTVTFPDGMTYAVSGFVQSISVPVPVKDKVMHSVVIKCTGAVTRVYV
jgi:hypothetical protein